MFPQSIHLASSALNTNHTWRVQQMLAEPSLDANRSGLAHQCHKLMSRRRGSRITWSSTINNDQGCSTSTTTINNIRKKINDRVKNTKRGSRKSLEAQVDVKDDLGSMSESARIAYLYRSSATAGVSVLDCLQSTQALVIIDNDSCSPQCTNMCPKDEHTVPPQALQVASRIHDMLCAAIPVIIEKADKGVDPQSVLTPYRRIVGNIVLDSPCPTIAPHIVISPPNDQDSLTAYYAAQGNRIPAQIFPSLVVPPFYMATSRMHTYNEWCAQFYAPALLQQEEQQYERTPGAHLVFNHRLFQEWVKETAAERSLQFVGRLLPVLTRKLLINAAFDASSAALNFRARYDSPGFLDSIETPFLWTDPAEAFLLQFRGHPVGVHHIPSQQPFSVPHILIEETWPNDCRVAEANTTPLQDCCGGEILVVLSSRRTAVSYLNDPQFIDDEDYPDSRSDTSSKCESPLPATPTDLQRVSSGFFLSEDTETMSIDSGYLHQESVESLSEEVDFYDPHTRCTGVKARFFIDEDEDDGPPEYDEWYQAIAERTMEREGSISSSDRNT